jgi:ribosomal peptide maturation radical SAM protein 1
MRVLLMNMPVVSLGRPAMGLSLLKAELEREGLPCRIAYANLLFAERIGRATYDLLNDTLSPAMFTGDWLFSQYLFGRRLDLQTYANTLRHHAGDDEVYRQVMAVRHEIGPFLEDCFARFDIGAYDVIGFTSTFEQNMASIVLAHAIKERYPKKIVVMGGANCEGAMGRELLGSFEWIDLIFSGEADRAFPECVKRLAAGAPLEGLPGLVFRVADRVRMAAPQDRVHDLDSLPDPDFDEYFAALKASPVARDVQPFLLIESARGCWWGAKSHCTFCGLNGETMAFRAKSPQRTYEELLRQSERYGVRRFQAVDNIISHDYFQTFLPMLRDRKPGVSLFYEIKSNLKREHVRLLKDAGVFAVQPGVESLNSHVLRLMKKGVTGIQNVQLLKLCREYGVEAAWNLLYGFPGETAEDYEQTARWIPALYHLRPPGAVSPFRLDRFSPNFDQAEHFGLVDIRPFAMYQLVYPLPPERVANIAYFFEYRYADGRQPGTYVGETLEKAKIWKQNRGGDLVKHYGNDPELMVIDTRPEHPHRCYPLNGIQREIYDFCGDIRSKATILEFARQRCGAHPDVDDALDAFLQQLEDWQLAVREGNQYLSLAIAPAEAALAHAA